MTKLKWLLIALWLVLSTQAFSNEIKVCYQLLDREAFQKTIVGNTIVGITRQSHSLYMLYFLPNGYCELWKQNKIYAGNWWIESDAQGRDLVRAFWPLYSSLEPQSLFSPENPHYGTATAIRYYYSPQNGAVFLAGKQRQASALLVSGCAFPALSK